MSRLGLLRPSYGRTRPHSPTPSCSSRSSGSVHTASSSSSSSSSIADAADFKSQLHTSFLSPPASLTRSRGTRGTRGARRGRRGRVANYAIWKRNSAEVEVPVPVNVCYDLWQDRPRIPEWMQWIQSVVVLEDDERMSQWSLETQQFGQTFKFSWLAKNMTPIKHRLIHWISVEDASKGLLQGFVSVKNKGEIQFRVLEGNQETGKEASTVIRLVISYQLPQVLLPLVDLLKPTVDGILLEYMQNFERVAVAEYKVIKGE